jgi:hypothetical protein
MESRNPPGRRIAFSVGIGTSVEHAATNAAIAMGIAKYDLFMDSSPLRKARRGWRFLLLR